MTETDSQPVDRRRFVIIIAIWLILIAFTLSGAERLTTDVDDTAEFLNPDTESGKGFLLFEERFKQTDDLVNLIVLKLDDDSDQDLRNDLSWQNYQLALVLSINATFYEKGYTRIFSSAIFEFAATQTTDPSEQQQYLSFAETLISTDGKSSLITLISNEWDFEDDQVLTREHVRELRLLVANTSAIIDFGVGLGMNLAELPLQSDFDELTVYVTGQVANFLDTTELSQDSFGESEIFAVLLIMFVLAVVFRSPMGIALPILGMVSALFPTYMATYLLAKAGLFAVSDFLAQIIGMIGIAVAVDYNLFSLVRFREEFRKRRAKHEREGTWTKEQIKRTQVEAARKMNATAGQAVMYSGFTVMIGFMSMLVVGSEFTQGMAIGVTIVVIFSILSARTLLPAILSLFGRFLDWPNFASRANQDVARQNEADAEHKEMQGVWVRWSKLVMKYPVYFLLLGLLILAPFVLLSLETELSFDSLKNTPLGVESRDGFEIIIEDFVLGETQPYLIVISAGLVDNSIFDQNIFDAVEEILRWALEDGSSRFDGIGAVNVQVNQTTGDFIILDVDTVVTMSKNSSVFAEFTSGFINYEYGNNTMVVELYANIDVGTAVAWSLAEDLAKKTHDVFASIEEVEEVYISGIAAAFNDTSDAMYDRVPLMLLVAVVLIYLALLVLFRSLIIPLKAILTIGGSLAFALGILVYVFQQGKLLEISLGDTILWEAEQTSGLMFFIPIFIFSTILGLGMDYSIIIISRIKEEADKGMEISDAVGLGLSKTAGVVTSAAIIMTSTFMVFALSPLLILQTMGLALSVGIIIDATISRIILLPAAMKLVGKGNWYLPKWLDRLLPKLDFEQND